jgi:hypothetical protein
MSIRSQAVTADNFGVTAIALAQPPGVGALIRVTPENQQSAEALTD